jgi:hypothetical protein
LAKKCSHEDTRLTCIDCSAPICGNCMVECPVGNRCKSCGTDATPVKKSTALGGVKLFGASLVVGAGGGWAMQYFSIPFLNCFLYFFVGLIAGRWLAKHIDYQMRDRAGKVIVFGTLLGMCFTPLSAIPPTAFGLLTIAFTTSPELIMKALLAVIGMLFTPAVFIAGILRPTVGGR